MAEKWIKLADEKARADTNMKEQITVDERHPARGDDRYPTCLASCGAASWSLTPGPPPFSSLNSFDADDNLSEDTEHRSADCAGEKRPPPGTQNGWVDWTKNPAAFSDTNVAGASRLERGVGSRHTTMPLSGDQN
jgi:hypothetical protein